MTKRLYPKELRYRRQPHLERRWRLDCNLVYDIGEGEWSKGYRTRVGARLAAWFHHNIASYGGSVYLVDQRGSD